MTTFDWVLVAIGGIGVLVHVAFVAVVAMSVNKVDEALRAIGSDESDSEAAK